MHCICWNKCNKIYMQYHVNFAVIIVGNLLAGPVLINDTHSYLNFNERFCSVYQVKKIFWIKLGICYQISISFVDQQKSDPSKIAYFQQQKNVCQQEIRNSWPNFNNFETENMQLLQTIEFSLISVIIL